MKCHSIKLRGICWSLVGLLLAAGGGCQQNALPASSAAQLVTQPSVLAAGDTVELRFFYANELTVTQTIRPDGKITLELVGEIQAAGLTPGDLAASSASNTASISSTRMSRSSCEPVTHGA